MNRKLTTTYLALFVMGTLLAACNGAVTPVVSATPEEVEATEAAAPTTVPETGEATAESGYPGPGVVPTDSGNSAYPGPDSADGSVFTVSTDTSSASYTVNEEFFSGAVTNLGKDLGFFTPVGITEQVSGYLILNMDGAVPAVVGGEIVVDISLLKSDDNRRDNKIRSDFLQSSRYPLATFVPTGTNGFPASYTEGDEVTFELVGQLTIREVTNTVTFEVTATLENGTITGVATTQVLMTDFGFSPPEISGFMKAENEVLITVNLVATQ